ncbi:thioredoxin domain-containing protein [Actinacidiphila yeochonensis]|uniref:thioredoxin domain-containing protein n=1 Tax=Actinacidiphila yeochonensis TaxID=89050 RepID=UPI00056C3C63|nr:thioredoxin domain-containing protein [Actinacidiphila yeochonensis]
MSSRNSKTAKAAARERLRAQREKEQKRAKVRRQVFVGVGVVVVLAAAAGIAVAVNNANKPSYWSAAAKDKLVVPAHASGKNGTTIIVGDAKNKNVLHEYEDLRCPVCAAYEQESGAAVLKGAQDGKYQIDYTLGTFLDDANPGDGSKKALSAAGAALNVSTEAFEQFHTLIYSKKYHPDENVDKLDDVSYLLKVADQVPALKGNTKFSDAVKKGTFDKWALTMSNAFNSSGVNQTPTVKLNGKDLSVVSVPSATVMSTIEAGLTK